MEEAGEWLSSGFTTEHEAIESIPLGRCCNFEYCFRKKEGGSSGGT